MEWLRKIVQYYLENHKKLARWNKVVSVMAALVVFVTTYALILPAITVDKASSTPAKGMYLEGSNGEYDEQENDDQWHEEYTQDGDEDLPHPGVESMEKPSKWVEEYQTEGEEDSETADKDDFENASVSEESFEYSLEASNDYYTVTLSYNDGNLIPEGSKLTVEELQKETKIYRKYLERVKKTLLADKENKKISDIDVRFFNLSLSNEDIEIQPYGKIRLDILTAPVKVEKSKKIKAIHFWANDEKDENEPEILKTEAEETEEGVETVRFEAEEAAMYAVVYSVDYEDKTEEELAAEASSEETTTEAAPEATSEATTTDATEATTEADAANEATTESPAETTEEKKPEAGTLAVSDNDYTVSVSYGADAKIPENAELNVKEFEKGSKEYNTYLSKLKETLDKEDSNKEISGLEVRFFDITIQDGEKEIQPDEKVNVEIKADPVKVEEPDQVQAVHFDGDKTEIIETQTAETKKGVESVQFEAEGFSVYGIVYTVDFHYSVDGKTYDFSIPGGGFVTLQQLVEILGIANDDVDSVNISSNEEDNGDSSAKDDYDSEEETEGIDKGTVQEEEEQSEKKLMLADVEISTQTKQFIEDVTNVEFSNPDLAWVGKVDETSTVDVLKEVNKLECQYSANLTEEQIDEINAQTVEAGDWALISLKPFTSNETLTITMRNGDQFVVDVSDALHVLPDQLVGKEIVIYDKTENRALTSDWEQNQWRTELKSIAYGGEGTSIQDNAHWIVEGGNGNYYLKSLDGKYLKIDNINVSLVNSQSEATVLTIEMGGNPDYRIYAKNDENKRLVYCDNSNNDGFFSAPGGANNGNSRQWLGIDYAVVTQDRAGDWMLYFDDDFDVITVHVGETITLRPYDKWEWLDGRTVNVRDGSSTADYLVQDQKYWNVGNWDSWAMSKNNNTNDITNGDSTVQKSTGSDGIFEFTRYIKKDDQLRTFYWSVQGVAKKTGDYTLTSSTGKTIIVHVVDGNPVNQPGTINKIANIKANLFDYDKEGVLDGSWNNNNQWWNDDNHANDNGFKNVSINKESGSSHFYFLSSGGGDKQGEPWNDYTHRNPNTGLVKDTLDNGYPVLNRTGEDAKSLQYLFDTSTASQSWHGGDNNDAMIAYPDVVGMFQKDPDTGYYYYNSNTNYFYYNTETGTSKLYEHTYTQTSSRDKNSLVNDKPIGFFPFHDYDATNNLSVNQNHNLNHHVGMSMDIEFMLPRDRKDDYGKDIIFEFSGDDDLWVFVEWEGDNGVKQSKLLLDIGGVHQPINRKIDFTNDDTVKEIVKTNRPYTLKVFYLERGGCDSNCSIRFNLPIIQDLVVAKKLTGLTEAEKNKYKNEEFEYELVVTREPDNIPTLYEYPNQENPFEKAVIRNAAGEDVTPTDFSIHNGRFTLKDGQTLTITYLDRSDKFTVAELKTDNMENFEVPNAERYYHQEHDASLYEEEINLIDSHTVSEPIYEDWVTPEYELEDTEKITFTNTLKEKNLEVEKKWKGEKDPPESITFTVSASVEKENGGHKAYAVSELKEEDGTTDKQFTLSADNHWRYEIEHLPVNTPDGKFIFYDISEGQVEGYALTGVTDLTAEDYNYCNVDVIKYWPDSNEEHTEVIKVVLKNSNNKYYAGVDNEGNAIFVDNIENAAVCNLTKDNNYIHRFERVPAGEYTAEQLNDDKYSKGLATYVRNIIQYELENSPIEQVDPSDKPNEPEIHKRIDALRDGVTNPDTVHDDEDLTDLYRLYLDYKIKSLQEANGVDLLFVIDHSGSMNNSAWQGNPYRAPAVEAALNGEDGLISEFLEMNEKNQWAAVGFKGPDGAENYYWSLTNPWEPATDLSKNNAGLNGSEILSSGGENYEFTRNDASPPNNVTLANEGANILTNYTAGLWRAEQFLAKQTVKDDGRKKVIVFISDGLPTLHIDCPNRTLQDAGTANGSWYYRDAYGGCPDETLTEFGYFVNDMTGNGYTFGENMEFYTIGFGGTMQTQAGSQLLNGMLDIAYGEDGHADHFMTISDTYYSPYDATIDYRTATENLKNDLRKIMGMNETFTNIVIQDELSAYVDLYGLTDEGTSTSAADIMNAAKAKVTMKVPDPNEPGETQTITLYENGAPVDNDNAKFTRADGTTKANIIKRLEYDLSSKTVKAVFDPEYQAVEDVVYTLSFDVKATEHAYTTFAATGYDKYTEGDKQGQVITGDEDTDFLGTNPDNATSVGKEGFRSNDEAKATYKHNGEDENLEYPHPVIQVAGKIDIVKVNQLGEALEGAKFNLYNSKYNPEKTIEENENCLIEADLQSKKPTNPAGNDAVIRSGKLGEGTYYLVETETPGGYNTLPGPVKITVTTVNGTLIVTAKIAGKPVEANMLILEDGVWKLKVQNSAGYELPHTGGPGTKVYITLGLIMIMLAGLASLALKKRREVVY